MLRYFGCLGKIAFLLGWVGHRSLIWMDGRDSLKIAKTNIECRDPRQSLKVIPNVARSTC